MFLSVLVLTLIVAIGLESAYSQTDRDLIQEWKEYVESYKEYMENYQTWADNTIKKLESENKNLKLEISKFESKQSPTINDVDISKYEDKIQSLESKNKKLELEVANLESKLSETLRQVSGSISISTSNKVVDPANKEPITQTIINKEPIKEYYQNTRLKSENWIDENGETIATKYYYKNGQLKNYREFGFIEDPEAGRPPSFTKISKSYHESGNLISEIYRDDNGITKTEIDYYDNGNPRHRNDYDNGALTQIGYYDNGNIRQVNKHPYNGNETETKYYNNGSIKAEIEYANNGHMYRETQYDKNGNYTIRTYADNGEIYISKHDKHGIKLS